MTLEWLPPSVRVELDAIKGDLPALNYIGYPDLILLTIEDKGLESKPLNYSIC
jgi:hypothetical protein